MTRCSLDRIIKHATSLRVPHTMVGRHIEHDIINSCRDMGPISTNRSTNNMSRSYWIMSRSDRIMWPSNWIMSRSNWIMSRSNWIMSRSNWSMSRSNFNQSQHRWYVAVKFEIGRDVILPNYVAIKFRILPPHIICVVIGWNHIAA